MKPRLKATRAARELIKAYEPFEPEAVRRGRRWVVGYGHTAAARPGVSVSRQDADLLLVYDVAEAEKAVKAIAGERLPAVSRDALISFAASVGPGAFKVSDVARHAAAGRHDAAAEALSHWIRVEADGRLVVSERLQRRRRAEKTLYLEGFSDGSGASVAEADEPRIGALIDVDIAFEDPPETVVGPLEALLAQTASAPEEDHAPAADPAAAPHADPAVEIDADADFEGEREAAIEAGPEADGAGDFETATPDIAAFAEPDGADAPAAMDEAAQRRTVQDAAVQSVVARMASQIAASIAAPSQAAVAAPAAEAARAAEAGSAEAPDGSRKFGFSYMTPTVLELAPYEPASKTDDTPAPQIRSALAAPMPGPVYATVTVGPYVAPAHIAPPHPADAPARAAGMSGESEGPDLADGPDGEGELDDDAGLDPVLVAGPEAPSLDALGPAPQQSEGRGDWIYGVNLALGLAMTGIGGWGVISDLPNYLAIGPTFGWAPVGLLIGGVLLSAASSWVLVSALRRRKAR